MFKFVYQLITFGTAYFEHVTGDMCESRRVTFISALNVRHRVV